MPYIVAKIQVPMSKILEAVRIYEEDKEYDRNSDVPTVASVVPLACKATLEGGEILSILKVDKEYLAQALETHNSWIARFSRVEGMRYSIDVYHTREEAMTFFASFTQ